MERILFQSLAKSDVGYVWYRSDYDTVWKYSSGRDYRLDDHAGLFMTYWGQDHDRESAVTVDDAVDYLASLAKYLHDNPTAENIECVAYGWPKPRLSQAIVRWALSVKYRDDKPQYYNLDERKVSTADSKRHDKRWEEVPKWCDGTTESAYGLLKSEFARSLELYATASFIDFVSRDIDRCGKSHRELARMAGILPRETEGRDCHEDNYRANNFDNCFWCVKQFVESSDALQNAIRGWGCIENNYCRNVLRIGIEESEVA